MAWGRGSGKLVNGYIVSILQNETGLEHYWQMSVMIRGSGPDARRTSQLCVPFIVTAVINFESQKVLWWSVVEGRIQEKVAAGSQ